MDSSNNLSGFKNHNPFYINMYKNLDTLKDMSLMANTDLSHIKNFYLCLKSAVIHYSPYIDIEEINKKIKDVEDLLLTHKMYKELNKGNFKTDESKELYNDIIKVLSSLNEVHSDLMAGLKEHGLLPQ